MSQITLDSRQKGLPWQNKFFILFPGCLAFPLKLTSFLDFSGTGKKQLNVTQILKFSNHFFRMLCLAQKQYAF